MDRILSVAAAPGSAVEAADSPHRIDPAIVRKEVEAGGFVFAGGSAVLRNPADDHGRAAFDPAARSRTDQFIYMFLKSK